MSLGIGSVKVLQCFGVVTSLIGGNSGILQRPGKHIMLLIDGSIFSLCKQPVPYSLDVVGKRPGIHMVAACKDRVVDGSTITSQLSGLGIYFCHRGMAIPEFFVSCHLAAQGFPKRCGCIHAGKCLGITFAYGYPEILILKGCHFLYIPLAGHQPLRSEQIRIFVADGNIGHATLGLAGAVDAVFIHAIAVNHIKQ